MKKSINKKVYNTETAKEIKTNVHSYFGDPEGYEEILYQTARGDYFVYGVGGTDSKYPEPAINPVTAKEAKEF